MDNKSPHKIGALSPELVLLGCLFENTGYGYDLHKRINQDLGSVWHLSQSQAYSILKRLHKAGDISMELIEQEKLPSKQLWHITETGKDRFLHWLNDTSGGSTRAIRLEFVTRVYFLTLYFPDQIPSAFRRQISEAQIQLDRMRALGEKLQDAYQFNRMSVDLRISQLEVTLSWLNKWMNAFNEEVDVRSK